MNRGMFSFQRRGVHNQNNSEHYKKDANSSACYDKLSDHIDNSQNNDIQRNNNMQPNNDIQEEIVKAQEIETSYANYLLENRKSAQVSQYTIKRNSYNSMDTSISKKKPMMEMYKEKKFLYLTM